MYTVIVAQVTIYLSIALRDAVKAEGLPVSEVCQRALRAEIKRRRRDRTASDRRSPAGKPKQEV